jgi:hypothetical protein
MTKSAKDLVPGDRVRKSNGRTYRVYAIAVVHVSPRAMAERSVLVYWHKSALFVCSRYAVSQVVEVCK